MKILVTGGAGFIASQIADAYIAEGHKVFILDNLSTGFEKNLNPKAVFIKKDIIDPSLSELFEKEKFDVVNHHAAQMDVRKSVADPSFDATTNILGTISLLLPLHFVLVRKYLRNEESYILICAEHSKRTNTFLLLVWKCHMVIVEMSDDSHQRGSKIVLHKLPLR